MSVSWKNGSPECEIKVPLGYYYLLTSYVENILEAMISIVLSYQDVGVIIEKYILSRIQKLADSDPAGNLDSWYGGGNEQKSTQINVIEVEIRTLST